MVKLYISCSMRCSYGCYPALRSRLRAPESGSDKYNLLIKSSNRYESVGIGTSRYRYRGKIQKRRS